MDVVLVNKLGNLGETKKMKIGFSWILCLFSGVFGIPLFIRKLYGWAITFIIIFLLFMFAAATNDMIFYLMIFILNIALSVYIGLKGNELTAKKLLNSGWAFLDPNSEEAKIAAKKWGILLNYNENK